MTSLLQSFLCVGREQFAGVSGRPREKGGQEPSDPRLGRQESLESAGGAWEVGGVGRASCSGVSPGCVAPQRAGDWKAFGRKRGRARVRRRGVGQALVRPRCDWREVKRGSESCAFSGGCACGRPASPAGEGEGEGEGSVSGLPGEAGGQRPERRAPWSGRRAGSRAAPRAAETHGRNRA